MNPINHESIEKVARKLKELGLPYAITGGASIAFLLDNPVFADLRPTNDIDAIVSVISRLEYTELEAKLRSLGFNHDMSEGAPICRWIFDEIKVDVMPTKDTTGNLSDQWFDYALATSGPRTLGDLTVPVITATCFISTKIVAFKDRGSGDYASHDLEDIITVLDGRKSIVEEVNKEEAGMKTYIVGFVNNLLKEDGFIDLMPGMLPGDEGSQGRVPMLLEKMKAIAELND